MPLSTEFVATGLGLSALAVMVAFVALKIRNRFAHLDRQLSQLARDLNRGLGTRLVEAIDERTQELQNGISLAQFGFRSPVFLGGWSIDSYLGRFLVEHIVEHRPRVIVELGSGASTLLIARCLENSGPSGYEHIAVDHDERYLELTRRQLHVNGMGDRVRLLHCPLDVAEGPTNSWYRDLPSQLEGLMIDLLVIDGPPGPSKSMARYPALPLLHPLLNPGCAVVLDDASRKDEKEIVSRWLAEFPSFSVSFVKHGHGVAVLSRTAC